MPDRLCKTCEGSGSVEDEDGPGVLWTCPQCNGTGEEPVNE